MWPSLTDRVGKDVNELGARDVQSYHPDLFNPEGPEPVTVNFGYAPGPAPTDCPKSWNQDSVCDFAIGNRAHSMGYPEVLNFEFQSINFIKDNLYKISIEFQIDPQGLTKSDLKNIVIYLDPTIEENSHMEFGLTLYDSESWENFIQDSPFHFVFIYPFISQQFGSFTCTTSFTINYRLKDGSELVYGHGCAGNPFHDTITSDSPLQCWSPACKNPEPAIIEPPPPQLPARKTYPESWSKDSICSVIGNRANVYPEVSEFEFKSIKFIKDNLYEVMVEFEADPSGLLLSELQSASIYVDQSADDYLADGVLIYEADSSINLVGDLPFHFIFVYVMATQEIGDLTCTTPFTIFYQWRDWESIYGHGCAGNPFSEDGDSGLHCWNKIEGDAETTKEQEKATTSPEDEISSQLNAEITTVPNEGTSDKQQDEGTRAFEEENTSEYEGQTTDGVPQEFNTEVENISSSELEDEIRMSSGESSTVEEAFDATSDPVNETTTESDETYTSEWKQESDNHADDTTTKAALDESTTFSEQTSTETEDENETAPYYASTSEHLDPTTSLQYADSTFKSEEEPSSEAVGEATLEPDVATTTEPDTESSLETKDEIRESHDETTPQTETETTVEPGDETSIGQEDEMVTDIGEYTSEFQEKNTIEENTTLLEIVTSTEPREQTTTNLEDEATSKQSHESNTEPQSNTISKEQADTTEIEDTIYTTDDETTFGKEDSATVDEDEKPTQPETRMNNEPEGETTETDIVTTTGLELKTITESESDNGTQLNETYTKSNEVTTAESENEYTTESEIKVVTEQEGTFTTHSQEITSIEPEESTSTPIEVSTKPEFSGPVESAAIPQHTIAPKVNPIENDSADMVNRPSSPTLTVSETLTELHENTTRAYTKIMIYPSTTTHQSKTLTESIKADPEIKSSGIFPETVASSSSGTFVNTVVTIDTNVGNTNDSPSVATTISPAQTYYYY
ncbi:hypothetical protein JA1_005404 [Spathaspora sp. JA1]|nr:hypothetical protein JA1_005404 [Spathaspora sp. JA1]